MWGYKNAQEDNIRPNVDRRFREAYKNIVFFFLTLLEGGNSTTDFEEGRGERSRWGQQN